MSLPLAAATSTDVPRDGATAEPPALGAHGISLAYDGRVVVQDLDLVVPAGRVTVVVGPNGCGKSTLLRGLGRLMRPSRGIVTLGGADIWSRSARSTASVLGLLPQQPSAPEAITVADLVGRGRYPHQGIFGRWRADDETVVAQALVATGTDDLAGRRVEELSGGQRQRVWIAMALAQDPRILLLDEPTTYLDVAHQVEILDLLRNLNRRRATTVVMVLHDLNLAARYADHLVVLAQGRIHCEGRPEDVLSVETVREAFGLSSVVISDPVTGGPLVVPIGDGQGTAS